LDNVAACAVRRPLRSSKRLTLLLRVHYGLAKARSFGPALILEEAEVPSIGSVQSILVDVRNQKIRLWVCAVSTLLRSSGLPFA